MSLIAMAVFDTVENERTQLTRRTLDSLIETIELENHRLFIVDNNSCEETKMLLRRYNAIPNIHVITNDENAGTARAINQAWRHREPKEHLIKMDNDVVVNSYGWVEEMEEAIERDTHIGIIGLKRKDLMENPYRNDMYKSTLQMLTPIHGQKWIIVENVEHVMGTCQMYNWRLIEKIGGLMQPGVYGFDDTLASFRCKLANFRNCFLPHIEIEHIDTKETSYWQEKRNLAMKDMAEFNELKYKLQTGQISIKVEL